MHAGQPIGPALVEVTLDVDAIVCGHIKAHAFFM
jgi:hypothetical protein